MPDEQDRELCDFDYPIDECRPAREPDEDCTCRAGVGADETCPVHGIGDTDLEPPEVLYRPELGGES